MESDGSLGPRGIVSDDSLGPRGIVSDDSLGPPGMVTSEESSDGSLGPRGHVSPPRHSVQPARPSVSVQPCVRQSATPVGRLMTRDLHLFAAPSNELIRRRGLCNFLTASSMLDNAILVALPRANMFGTLQSQEHIDRVCTYLSGPISRPVAQMVTEAKLVGIHRNKLNKCILRQTACQEQLSLMYFNSLAANLEKLIVGDKAEAVAATEVIANDEVSASVRRDDGEKLSVGDTGVVGITHHASASNPRKVWTKVTAKVMAMYPRWAFTIRTGDNRLIQVVMVPPVRLYNMDRNTGETTYECVKRTQKLFPCVSRLLQHFPFRRAFNNDRASQNERLCSKFRQDASTAKGNDTPHLRQPCDSHDCMTCQTLQFDAKPLLVSNIVHTGMQQRQAGAVAAVRLAVSCAFRARLCIIKCSAPPSEFSSDAVHRDGILQTFLGSTHGVEGFRRCFILRRMLNGSWIERRIVHWCVPGCCVGVDTLEVFLTDVLDALVPCSCPLLQRGKWLAAEPAVDWVGLLSNVCCLFEDCMVHVSRHLSDHSYAISIEQFKLVIWPEGLDEALVPGEAAAPEADLDNLFIDLELDDGREAVPTLADGSPDWATYNKKVGSRVCAFARSSPATDITILKRSMASVQSLHKHIIFMGGTGYMAKNIRLCNSNLTPHQHLVDCAKGRVTKKFWLIVENQIFDPDYWSAVPIMSRTQAAKTSAFKCCIKGAAAVFVHLDSRHKRFPSLLYSTLHASGADVDAVQTAAKNACVLEPFSELHLKQCLGDLKSARSAALLSNDASIVENQIDWVEHGHALIHQIVKSALQAKAPDIKHICRDITAARQRQHELNAFDNPISDGQWTSAAIRRLRTPSRPLSMKPRAIKRRQAREAAGLPLGRKGVSSSYNIFQGRRTIRSTGVLTGRQQRRQARQFAARSAAEKMADRAAARARTQVRQSRRFLAAHPELSIPDAMNIIDDEAETHDFASLQQACEQNSGDFSRTLAALLQELKEAASRDAKRRKLQEKGQHARFHHWMGTNLGGLPNLGTMDINAFAERVSEDKHTRVLVFKAVTSKLAAYAMKRMPGKWLKATEVAQSQRWADVIHDQCEALGKLPSSSLRPCQLAVGCVCKGERKALGQFVQQLRAWSRKQFPAKTPSRRALKQGELVFRIVFEDSVEGWWHISFTNLVTFLSCYLRLSRRTDEIDVREAHPNICLQVDRPLQLALPWAAFETFVLSRNWRTACVSKHLLMSSKAKMDHAFRLYVLEVRKISELEPLFDPARAHSDDALDLPLEDYIDPEPAVAVAAPPGEDDPLDLIYEEMGGGAFDLHVGGGGESIPGDGFVAGGVVGPSGVAASSSAAGSSGEGDGGVAALVERKRYEFENIFHKESGELLGVIRVWTGGFSLTARCQKCKARKNRKYEEFAGDNPSSRPQGRPMGALLAWLHLPCTGIGGDHSSQFTDEALPFDDRRNCRLHWYGFGLDTQFHAERDPWPAEREEDGYEPLQLC